MGSPGFEVNDIRNWRIEDPHPDLSIEAIASMSTRSESLLARRRDRTVLRTHFLSVAGAVDSLRGLDYHYSRFMNVLDALAAAETTDETSLLHEAVAYINRIGQFQSFATSEVVTDVLGDCQAMIPKINHLRKFRDKHTAHRSIDKPRKEDTPWLRTVHAMSLSRFGGQLWRPKLPLPPDFTGPFWGRAYLTYQLNMGSADSVFEFTPELDHALVMTEAYGLLDKLLSEAAQPDAADGARLEMERRS